MNPLSMITAASGRPDHHVRSSWPTAGNDTAKGDAPVGRHLLPPYPVGSLLLGLGPVTRWATYRAESGLGLEGARHRPVLPGQSAAGPPQRFGAAGAAPSAVGVGRDGRVS